VGQVRSPAAAIARGVGERVVRALSREPEVPVWWLALSACSPDETAGPGEAAPEPAPLVTPSGTCPSGSAATESITSYGLDRNVRVVAPAAPEPDLPIVFVFHGLSTPFDVIGSFVSGFDLEDAAEELGVIFVVPESRTVAMPVVGDVLLWGILDDEEPDLALYDDLRTCVVEAYDADPFRVSAWGHSGGALWASDLAINRADTLAGFGAFSGGANLEIPLLGGPFVPYVTPAATIPAFLATAGDEDVWPDPTLVLVDFEAATTSLETALVADGNPVARCRHDQGHFVVPPDLYDGMLDFLVDQRFGEPPAFGDGAGLPAGCWLSDGAPE
jgi:hypothetical protein